jgi:hypothetical protein
MSLKSYNFHRNLDEIKKSPNWNSIYKELIKHQDLMEIFMDAIIKFKMNLAACEKRLAELEVSK